MEGLISVVLKDNAKIESFPLTFGVFDKFVAIYCYKRGFKL